jgi:hypothetical protein
MGLKSRYIRGALAFYDTHRMRLIDAIGADVVKWELAAQDAQDTGGGGTDPRGYVTTMVEAGAGGNSEVEASDEVGVAWELITDNADNDGINIQLNGEAFKLTSGRDVYFGIELQANDATQSDFLAGLCISDTDLLGGMTDGVYLEKLDGGTGVSTVTEKDSTETQSDDEHVFAADTAVTLEFYWDGSKVHFFINGVEVGTSSTNVPDDEELTPSIHFLTGEAAVKRMKVHWARAIQIG